MVLERFFKGILFELRFEWCVSVKVKGGWSRGDWSRVIIFDIGGKVFVYLSGMIMW